MSVVVLTKFKNKYYLHADSRTSEDWMGINTDGAIKVFKGNTHICGVVGDASAKLVMQEVLSKGNKPIQVLNRLHDRKYKHLLKNSQTLVATRSFGIYTIAIHKSILSSDVNIAIIPWPDSALPQSIGSGSLAVRAILSLLPEIKPIDVKNSIVQAYKVNHTIGGPVNFVSLGKGK